MLPSLFQGLGVSPAHSPTISGIVGIVSVLGVALLGDAVVAHVNFH